MSKTASGRKTASFGPDLDDDDEIEIIEVIGLDEDSPAGAPIDDDEIVVDLGCDEALPPEEVVPGKQEPPPENVESSAPSAREISDRERYARLQADFETFKRRTEREQRRVEEQATAALVRRMLPVLDNFERALALELSPDNELALRDGVVLIFRQILDELRKEGLEALEVVGQRFDPAFHDAVETDAESGYPPNTVVEELQRGYSLRQALLRPALVRVSVDPDGPGQEGA